MHALLVARSHASLPSLLLDVGMRVIAALLILLLGAWLAAWLANLARRALHRVHVDDTLSGFLRNLLYGLLLAALIAMALTTLGVSPAPLIAALGTIGLAIGLALQSSLSNLAWGVLLVIFRPYEVGDFVTVGGLNGTVEGINLLHTMLVLPDHRVAVIPNAKIGSDAILNFNRCRSRRIELRLDVTLQSSLNIELAALRTLVQQESLVLPEPTPTVWVDAIGDKTVTLLLRAWVHSTDVRAAKDALLQTLKRRIDSGELKLTAGSS